MLLTNLQTYPTEQNTGSSFSIGQILMVEVREASGRPGSFTNVYPVNPGNCLKIPSIGCITIRNRNFDQLRASIESAFIRGQILNRVTVNLFRRTSTVNYQTSLRPRGRIYIRVMESAGQVAWRGWFPIDGSGRIHIPWVGTVSVQGQNLFQVEQVIQRGVRNGFLNSGVVHLANTVI